MTKLERAKRYLIEHNIPIRVRIGSAFGLNAAPHTPRTMVEAFGVRGEPIYVKTRKK